MNVKYTVFALFFVLAASARLASAQYYVPHHHYGHYGHYPAQYQGGYSGYGYYHHASTLEEGMANGIANLIHSAGAANLLHSQAARNYQEAQSRYLDNRLKATGTYFEMRKINREAVAAERGPKPTPEAMVRFAKDRAPDRLSPSELDLLTGRIEWPAVLENAAYKSGREQIEALVLQWARYKGHLDPSDYLALQEAAKAMQAELKDNIKAYPPGEYVKAKNLLESLSYELVRREAAIAKGSAEEPERFVADHR